MHKKCKKFNLCSNLCIKLQKKRGVKAPLFWWKNGGGIFPFSKSGKRGENIEKEQSKNFSALCFFKVFPIGKGTYCK
jgi:hypothetical protein